MNWKSPRSSKAYIEDGSLRLDILPRGLTWLDTGTHESMMQASQYVYAVEERSGVKIACLEEIALNKGWISKSMSSAADRMGNGSYSKYLKQISAMNITETKAERTPSSSIRWSMATSAGIP